MSKKTKMSKNCQKNCQICWKTVKNFENQSKNLQKYRETVEMAKTVRKPSKMLKKKKISKNR